MGRSTGEKAGDSRFIYEKPLGSSGLSTLYLYVRHCAENKQNVSVAGLLYASAHGGQSLCPGREPPGMLTDSRVKAGYSSGDPVQIDCR